MIELLVLLTIFGGPIAYVATRAPYRVRYLSGRGSYIIEKWEFPFGYFQDFDGGYWKTEEEAIAAAEKMKESKYVR